MEIKSYAKVNVFLKICGKRDNYHLLASRFCKVESLYDTLHFAPKKTNHFELYGNFSCELQHNTLYKASQALIRSFPQAQEFFDQFAIHIEKKIPEFAGLGGGSSNAGVLLNYVNNYLQLAATPHTLAEIGKSIGADIPFFVYDYASANVTGIGENVVEFMEDRLQFEVFTPQVQCNTKAVFEAFRNDFYTQISPQEEQKLLTMSSKAITQCLSINDANVLYPAAKKLYPALQEYAQDGWFFSGSGSSFFRIL